ncbi:acyl carrier protein [Desulfosporosinus sp. OT]|uniref:acyl carrier protein n=1 Tax=Desulfosporosinus sp. OT TaxID=913865 RepID=UPI000223A7A6|nr:acyl carrier protein [Desulfosporosinus sp. OT]EGW37768.1 acyl carrier protein [Desulfosporosinus sp. OT]
MEDRVISTLKHILNKRYMQITLESRLREDLNVDSLDLLMILGDLEDEFATTLSDEDFSDVVTVNDIVIKLRARRIQDYRHVFE